MLPKFSTYMLEHTGISTMTVFNASTSLPKDLPITTPLTFPRYDGKHVLTLDKNGWWNPLGGHINIGEIWTDTLIRESLEEAGVVVRTIKVVGFILAQRISVIDQARAKYPPLSILPITTSTVSRYNKHWKPIETIDRGIFSEGRARKLLKRRSDNNQMLEIFEYIIAQGHEK